MLGFLSSPLFLHHDTGSGHPERPERIARILHVVETSELKRSLQPIEPVPATLDDVRLVHSGTHVETVVAACRRAPASIDADTHVGTRSLDTALLAVGGCLQASGAVVEGKVTGAFCAVRPPGHHAERGRAMGFCLFNNIAVAARSLQRTHGLERIFILDWDVHHGNGTQDIFYEDPSVFYASLHQWPLYPGTGAGHERGAGPGEGTTLNLPMQPGQGDTHYLSAVRDHVLPAMRTFHPDAILISAGFDAHRDDPLANMLVTEHGFFEMTGLVREVAEDICGGRVVSFLEGGYHLDALARSVSAHLHALLPSINEE